jgi:5-methylcytosine-specific restriction endonuclease McrA
MHQDDLDYIPSKGITRGATRGETMRDGFIRKYLNGDIRKSDGMVFYAYRYLNGKYQENWRSQESYQKSLKHDVEVGRIYRKENAEKVKKANRRWVENNRDKVSATQRRWYAKDLDHSRAIVKKWQKKNPEKLTAIWAKRRSYEQHAILMLHKDQWKIIDAIYDYSRRITKCIGIPHHVDHIMPISRGGYHIHTNLQVIPAILNQRKKDKLPHEFSIAA